MRSILIRSRVGADGMLHMNVPSDLVETEVEVMVILQPLTSSPATGADELAWSPNFFGSVVGDWEGNPLRREYEGEYETRQG